MRESPSTKSLRRSAVFPRSCRNRSPATTLSGNNESALCGGSFGLGAGGGSASGTEVLVKIPAREDEEQSLTSRCCLAALVAIEQRSIEGFILIPLPFRRRRAVRARAASAGRPSRGDGAMRGTLHGAYSTDRGPSCAMWSGIVAVLAST